MSRKLTAAGIALAAAFLVTAAMAQQFVPRDENPEDYPAGAGRDDTFYSCTACHGFKLIAQQGMSRRQLGISSRQIFSTAAVITAQPAKRLLPERTPRNGCSPAATNNLAADAKGSDPEKARSVAALSPSVWPLRYRLWVLRSWAPYPVCF